MFTNHTRLASDNTNFLSPLSKLNIVQSRIC